MQERLTPLSFRHPLVAGEIAVGAYVSEPTRHKFACHRGPLVGAVLKQQPAAGLQVERGGLNDFAQAGQGVRPRGEGTRGLVLQSRMLHRRIVCRDIGGVADDKIEFAPRQRGKPGAGQELDSCKAQRRGVGLCCREGRLGHVRSDNGPVRPLRRQSEGDCAGASAKIGHPT